MLTIQPKITQYSNTQKITFKSSNAEAVSNGLTEEENKFYESKTKHYEKQVQAFDNLIHDTHTPNTFKKALKVFKIISEGLLEGWAVAWGAAKGANIMKSSAISGANSKVAKGTQKVLTPLFTKIKTGGSKLFEKIAKGIDNIKTSKLYTNLSDRLTLLTEKMNANPVGKYIVKGFEYIGKAFKYVGGLIAKGIKKIVEPFKGVKAEEVYDKAAKVTSNTMGVGAGAAGAYNAATKDSKKTVEQTPTNTTVDNELDEVERMIEEGE